MTQPLSRNKEVSYKCGSHWLTLLISWWARNRNSFKELGAGICGIKLKKLSSDFKSDFSWYEITEVVTDFMQFSSYFKIVGNLANITDYYEKYLCQGIFFLSQVSNIILEYLIIDKICHFEHGQPYSLVYVQALQNIIFRLQWQDIHCFQFLIYHKKLGQCLLPQVINKSILIE